jgi:hypothetical protein
MVRFRRHVGDDGALHFEVLETAGENPIADQDPSRLCTEEEEARAAEASGFSADDPARRFIAPEFQSYPFGYERIAQLFDSPHGPDLAVSVRDWCQGDQPGTHGALHVRQARAPLWIAGPGIRPGAYPLAARAVDIAPTCLAACGFPKIDGADASGRQASERGAAPDVYLARQDGRVLEEILQDGANPAERLYIFLLDGLHMTELDRRLATEPDALPALRRLREGAAVLEHGSIVNFPSITWPSHTAIGTGAWCGHHDVVNPTYWLREKRESVSPQGQQLETEGYASAAVESLSEAFHRVRPGCMTAAIHAPFGRAAKHAVFEGRNLGDKERMKALGRELCRDESPRWGDEGRREAVLYSRLDTRGVAQVIDLFTREDLPPPSFVFHELLLTDIAGHEYGPHGEGLRDALDETDLRVGRVLDLLEELGLRDETLFVLTADHGMAPQDVALDANPAWQVVRAGMQAFVAEPLIWLKDVSIGIERASDHRTARVEVRELDPLPSGECPAVEGAGVVVCWRDGAAVHELARGHTGPGGLYGFATPSHVASDAIDVRVDPPGFNARHLGLDGSAQAPDLRHVLYGEGRGDA